MIKRICFKIKKSQKMESKFSKKKRTNRVIWMKLKIKMEDKKFNLLMNLVTSSWFNYFKIRRTFLLNSSSIYRHS